MPATGGNKVTALPPGMELAADRIEKLSLAGRTGHNALVGPAYQTIWTSGGIRPQINRDNHVPVTMISEASNDAQGDSGAQRVKLRGIDTNGLRVEENVWLNGNIEVESDTIWKHLDGALTNRGDVNHGKIIIQADGTTIAEIPEGDGQSQVAAWRAGDTETGYLTSFVASAVGAVEISVWMRWNERPDVFKKKVSTSVMNGAMTYQLPNPVTISPTTDIEFRARSLDGNDAYVHVDFQVIVELD